MLEQHVITLARDGGGGGVEGPTYARRIRLFIIRLNMTCRPKLPKELFNETTFQLWARVN